MANDKSCPKYVNYIQVIENNKINTNTNRSPHTTNTPISNNKSSYQSEFPLLPPRTWGIRNQEPKVNNTPAASTSTTATSDIAEILNFFKGLNLSGMISTMKNVIHKIKTAPDTITKITIVLEAIVTLLE